MHSAVLSCFLALTLGGGWPDPGFWRPPAWRSDPYVRVQEAGYPGPTPSGRVPSLQQGSEMALTIIGETRAITAGMNTHAETHVAAHLTRSAACSASGRGRPPVGYALLLGWLGRVGTVCLVGIEGAGSPLNTSPAASV